jgi:N-acetylmuramic acid 6-phosphate (MurNAc-6-P) etherase
MSRLLIDSTAVVLDTRVLHLVAGADDARRIAAEGSSDAFRIGLAALAHLWRLMEQHEVVVYVPFSGLQRGTADYLRGQGATVTWRTWRKEREEADAAVVAQRGLDRSADFVPPLRLDTWEVPS